MSGTKAPALNGWAALVRATTEAATDLVFALDNDDEPSAEAAAALGIYRVTGPRNHLAGWTNVVARHCTKEYRVLASLGDDHVPRTPGWDRLLLEAIGVMGGTGFAYGNDLLKGRPCQPPWQSAAISSPRSAGCANRRCGLAELGWSPRALARRINRVSGVGTVAETAPYHWRDAGRVPRPPLPALAAWVLSRELGRPVTIAELWQGHAAATVEPASAWPGVAHTKSPT